MFRGSVDLWLSRGFGARPAGGRPGLVMQYQHLFERLACAESSPHCGLSRVPAQSPQHVR
jgi:hypothetical protein